MPVISVISSKGGTGKSTSAVLLGLELSERARSVAIIDSDVNTPVLRWSKLKGKPENLHVIADTSEESILDTIKEATKTNTFIIIDVEGVASVTSAYVISRSDIVIIPSQGSQLDAFEAVKTIKLVKRQEDAFSRKIPCAILFTKTSAAIETRDIKDIRGQFMKAGISVFDTKMVERAAFRAIFSFGGTLKDLDSDQVSGIASAKKNASAFMMEVVSMLKVHRGEVSR